MQPSTQSEINRKISRSLLARRESPPLETNAPRLVALIAEFRRGMALQRQRDAEILAGLIRALSSGCEDAGRFFAIVKEEFEKRC
jgi:hypothetical protein